MKRRLFSRQGLSQVAFVLILLTLLHAASLFVTSPTRRAPRSVWNFLAKDSSQELVHSLSPDVENIVQAEWLIREADDLDRDDTIDSLFEKRKTRILRQIIGEDKSLSLPEVTAIISLRNFENSEQAIKSLRNIMEYLPRDIVTDVIVIVSEYEFTMGAKKINRDQMEEEIDKCDMCSLIFLNNYVFENINLVLHYVRNDLVVCIDGRVQLTEFWLEPMVARMSVHHNLNLVISPHLRLSSPDGEEINVGDYQTHITWDLGVVRSSDDQFLHEIHTNDPLFINQSAISKEVFLFSRQYAEDSLMFDMRRETFGPEDVTMSIKLLSCGGVVLQSRVSVVLLPLTDDSVVTPQRLLKYPDIINPSFLSPKVDMSLFFRINSRYWLDWEADMIVYCSAKRKSQSNKITLSRDDLKNFKYLRNFGCKIGNFKEVILNSQPRMLFPNRNSTFYGFIRSISGMYSIGALNIHGEDDISSKRLVLSRNSSQWIGYFSYVNMNIVYKDSHCITETDGYVYTSICEKSNKRQLFMFEENMFRLKRDPHQCIGVSKTSAVHSYLRLIDCKTINVIFKFKFDSQYKPNCIEKMEMERPTRSQEQKLKMAEQIKKVQPKLIRFIP